MKAFIVAALVSAIFPFSAASSADLLEDAPGAMSAPLTGDTLQPGWDGPYAGLTFGLGQLDGSFSDNCGCEAAADAQGRRIGVFVGHNWLIADRSWIGLESEFAYDWRPLNVAGTQVGTDLTGSVRVRLGEEIGPALFYTAMGWTAASAFVKNPDDREVVHGLTFALGVDWPVDEATFLRAEYRYNDYSSVELSGVQVDFQRDIISVGIARRF